MKLILFSMTLLASLSSFANCVMKYDGGNAEKYNTRLYLDHPTVLSVLTEKGYVLSHSKDIPAGTPFFTLESRVKLPTKSSNSWVKAENAIRIFKNQDGIKSLHSASVKDCEVHDDDGDKWWVVSRCSAQTEELLNGLPHCEEVDSSII